MKSRYGQVALLLVGILAVSLGITALCGVRHTEPPAEQVYVVTSAYPMYTATLRVVQGSDGVAVHCLTKATAGCLHEYQLSPEERAVLDKADVLILNGAGAEPFIEPLRPQLTATVVDTAAWALPDEEHTHEHEHEGHSHAMNEHIWLDPTMYTAQVRAICQALCEADRENEALYRSNAEAYATEIAAVAAELTEAAAQLPRTAVLFHDSMVYIAEAAKLDVVATLPIGEDGGFSSAEVAAAAEAVRGQDAVFLYDDQYPLQMTQLTEYAERGVVVTLNSAAMARTGVDDKDAWVHAMRENITWLKAAAQ